MLFAKYRIEIAVQKLELAIVIAKSTLRISKTT